jgi:FMN-dependent NADH-azoreductase
MKKMIVIDSCMRAESRTKLILDAAVAELSKRYEVEIIDVNSLGLPPLDKVTYVDQRENGNSPSLAIELARKVATCDRLVVAAPFWDMSFPAILKSFFENISLFDITFTDNGTTCVGLCKCEKVLFITTRGMDIRTGDPLDQGSPYLTALSFLWGLGEVITVAATNMDYLSPEDLALRIEAAKKEAVEICKEF